MLTATAGWPASQLQPLRFALRGVLISLALFGLVRLGWTESHIVLPLTLAEGALALRWFGTPALPVNVTIACSGADVLSLCLGAIFAYPAAWGRRVSGALGGLALIAALNIARIGTLGRIAGTPFWFNACHLYIWPAAMTLAIGAYVFVWMRASDTAEGAWAQSPETARNLPRRFVAFAGVFILIFVAAAPLYLHNAAVLSAGGFIARTSAALLAFAGIQAHAAGNILWMARGGGFAVTEECISTPLIPVYFAAIATWSSGWKQRSVGFAAAVPIFVLLGVVRLLVVALPGSADAQSFFVHAFYQLLAGALCVVAAAWWRHRDRTAAGWAGCGLAVGAVCIALVWPASLRFMSRAGVLPISDAQGAVAFLPVFQLALYLALCTAAFLTDGWKRFAAGLVFLVTSQALGLAALAFLTRHAGMTMAVRDVRGWAIAAPVVIFAAVVSLGRARR